MKALNKRPTPETDAAIHVCSDTSSEWHGDWVSADDARRLERERDEARDAAEKAKAFKRVIKEDNAKLRRELAAERALADRLAQFIDLITDALGPYQYLNGTLIVRDAYRIMAAWKEARK